MSPVGNANVAHFSENERPCMICKTDPGRPRIDLAGKRLFLAGAVWLWERSLDSLFHRGIWIEVEGCLTAESRCRAGFVKDFFVETSWKLQIG